MKPGDIITKLDGKTVDTPNLLSRLIAGLEPGATTHIEVVREGKRQILSVALSERNGRRFRFKRSPKVLPSKRCRS